MLARVLLAVETAAMQRRLRRLLKQAGDVVVHAASKNGADLVQQVGRDNYDVLIVSQTALSSGERDVIAEIHNLPEAPELVVVCAEESVEEQARLLAAGCQAVWYEGLSNETLNESLVTVLQRRSDKLQDAITRRVGPKPRLSDFVSESPAMLAFMDVVGRVVSSQTSLLITGETGVGKERLARAIHAESPRAAGPFVAVNCGALPDSLLESELFGHEEGAFTGASRARRGWFELAHGGTIFLDEIGETPLHLQVKLLHVLQNHEVQRLGSERSLAIDVRVMAATNRDLAGDIEAKRFRKDLYYRLSVVNLTIPPLSQRREDIPSLVDDYIDHFRAQIPHDVSGVTDEALTRLTHYSWPGNVRELINVIERAMLLCSGPKIDLSDLPESISRGFFESAPLASSSAACESATLPEDWLNQPLREVRAQIVANFERAYLSGLLAATGGRVGETARRAGLEPRSLFEKMRRYQLRKEDFRPRKNS